ncbi:MAG: hypothetical protein JWN25_3584, partial [Verrucomicrobiales bacterium]|nr:hypothetical protein [Verrucomicrobiales bacterium]
PIYWHVLSSLLAGVSLFMPILVIKFAWNFVGNHKNHRSLKWLGLSFATRPGMTAVALIVSYVALLQLRGLVFPDMRSPANFREAINILGKWYMGEYLTQVVFLPVLALVILAREYQRSRMASSQVNAHRASNSTVE